MTNQESATMPIIASAFENGKAFIPFVTCGDPDLATTEQLIIAMADSGASLIELGIPFSDPTAEGPIIQGADLRALSNNITTDDVFDMVARVRGRVSVPLVFMTYANVVYAYGADGFCKRAAEVGVAGLILPDVPFEERETFSGAVHAHGLELISMIAPTSHERIRKIASEAEGFLYVVSSMGVTGTRTDFSSDIASMISTVREVTDIPCAVGFGISTPEQARDMAAISDGAIVGSAIVKLVAQNGRESAGPVAAFVKSFSEAVSS